MATNRTESAGAASADAGTETPAAPAPSRSGFKAWLPLIITVTAMPALAYAMTNFVLLPKLQRGLGIAPLPVHAAGNAKKTGSEKKESYSINKLLVNVAGTMGSRYLQVSLSLEGTDPDFKTKIQEAEPKLKDMACGTLVTKTLADLEKPGVRNLIRTELITGFNALLGDAVVQEIYFTDFAIQ
jgi:flagellar FliL protein